MFYIFHGDDTHSQKKTLDSLLSKLGDPGLLDLNTTRLEGSISLADLQQACDAIPFLAKVRLVLVRGWLSSKPDKSIINDLISYLPHLPATTRLVFLEFQALSDKHKLVQFALEAKTGYVKQFDQPVGVGLERWIMQRATEKNGRIAPGAANLLATQIGSNLEIIDNELEKLVLYKGPEEMIDIAAVNLLCPYVAEASIFDLVDALGNRHGERAAILLQEKFMEGADPFYLFAMFVRQFRLLIQVKELAVNGERAAGISKQLRMHSYVAGKLYQQAQQFGLPQLEQIYRHLLDIDVGIKVGRQDMTTALNLLVSGLTAN
jgi:DNA polymerase-3 subunit delta